MERVVKNPFPWSANGISIEVLKPGDARDFGELTAGLEAAGFLESEGAQPPNSGGSATDGTGGDGPTEVVIPENWQGLHHATKKKLAREITGEDPANTAAAEAVIEAEIARRAAAEAEVQA